MDLSKFNNDIKSKIYNALHDLTSPGKIDLSEMKEMGLTKEQELELMSQLAGNPDMIGDGFIRKTTVEGSTILFQENPKQGVVTLTDENLAKFRAKYNNPDIQEGFIRNGVLYFRDSNGNLIRNLKTQNFISERIYKDDNPYPFLNQDGTVDNEKFIEYLNSLPPADKEYTELMQDIENLSEENAKMSVSRSVNIQKNRFKEFFKAMNNNDYSKAGELLFSYFEADCKDFDKNVLSKIKEGLTIITGAKWAGPALYKICADMAEDNDPNHINLGERILVGTANVDKGLGDFIFSTEGLLTMGAIAGGEALIAKASSTLAPYIGGVIHSYFGAEGTMMVTEGAVKVVTGETLDEIAEGGQEIGHGLPMMGTVLRAGKAVVDGLKNVSISELPSVSKKFSIIAEKDKSVFATAKTIEELDTKFSECIVDADTKAKRNALIREYSIHRERLTLNDKDKTDIQTFRNFLSSQEFLNDEYLKTPDGNKFYNWLKSNPKNLESYVMFVNNGRPAIMLECSKKVNFEPSVIRHNEMYMKTVAIKNNKHKFMLIGFHDVVYSVIGPNKELFTKRLNLSENTSPETIYELLTSEDGPIATETLGKDLMSMILGTPKYDACIGELEARIPNFITDMRYADDLSSYKKALKDILNSENSPYKDMPKDFVEELNSKIDGITQVRSAEEVLGYGGKTFGYDFISYTGDASKPTKNIENVVKNIRIKQAISEILKTNPDFYNRAKQYYLSDEETIELSKYTEAEQNAVFEMINRGVNRFSIRKVITYYHSDIFKYKKLLEYGVEPIKAAAYTVNEEYYNNLIKELESNPNAIKELLDSPDYFSKIQKSSASKYQKEFVEILKPENITYEIRRKLIESGLSEQELLSSIQKLAKYTFKLAYETPHQYLSDIDVQWTNPVEGKLPTPPEEVMKDFRLNITSFIKANLTSLIRTLKFIDPDTLNHFMDKRTNLFEKTLKDLDKISDDNMQILSKLLKCKSAKTGKNLSPKEKMELCKIVQIFQDAKIDMSILNKMIEENSVDISIPKNMISDAVLKTAGVETSGIVLNKGKFNQDYAYLALYNSAPVANLEEVINVYESTLPIVRIDETVRKQLIDETEANLINPMFASFMSKEEKIVIKKLVEMFKNIDKYTDEEILSVIRKSVELSCRKNATSPELNTVIREATINDFHQFINNPENIYGQANLKTREAFEQYHLNQNQFLNPDIEDVEVNIGGKTVKIRMWGRNPQEDLFIGNKTTCCTAIGAGNGAATPLYLLNECFSVVELYDSNGEVVGMSRIHMALADGKPKLIMDNIEISNNFLKGMSLEDKKAIRDGYFKYMNQLAQKITGEKTEVYYCKTDAVDVPTDDLNVVETKVDFIGTLSAEKVYFNSAGCRWINPAELKEQGQSWFIVPNEEVQ